MRFTVRGAPVLGVRTTQRGLSCRMTGPRRPVWGLSADLRPPLLLCVAAIVALFAAGVGVEGCALELAPLWGGSRPRLRTMSRVRRVPQPVRRQKLGAPGGPVELGGTPHVASRALLVTPAALGSLVAWLLLRWERSQRRFGLR